MIKRRNHCPGTQSLGRAQHTTVEARELSSGTPSYTDTTHSIFHLWEVSGTFSCLWVALCSHRNNKKTSEHGNKLVHDTVKDTPLKQMIVVILTRVHQDDPAWGDWCMAGEEVNSWVDASSLVMGVVLENHGATLED